MKGPYVAALALLLVSGAVHAQGNARGAAHVAKMFRESDTNRDGVITQAEARAAAAREFRTHDLDGDGLLSHAEIRKMQLDAGASQLPRALQTTVIDAAFAYFDVDGDRRITPANVQHTQVQLLLQADFDQDGQVTLQEARQLHGLGGP